VIRSPPAKVEVAVVVAMMEPTVGEETETNLVPSNCTRALLENTEALVPPLVMPRMPVMLEARSMRPVVMAPAVALRKPLILLMVNPPPVMFRPPAMVEVAVEEATKYGTSIPCVVESPPVNLKPPANVEVAVEVEIRYPTLKALVLPNVQ